MREASRSSTQAYIGLMEKPGQHRTSLSHTFFFTYCLPARAVLSNSLLTLSKLLDLLCCSKRLSRLSSCQNIQATAQWHTMSTGPFMLATINLKTFPQKSLHMCSMLSQMFGRRTERCTLQTHGPTPTSIIPQTLGTILARMCMDV